MQSFHQRKNNSLSLQPMTRKNPLLVLSTIVIILVQPISSVHHAHSKCQKSCGPKHGPKYFPYPFGFSTGCKIRLNCTEMGRAQIGEFSVQSISSEKITITVEAKCYRPFQSIHQLFSRKYAPTVRNAILLQNCSSATSPTCVFPVEATTVQTNFETPNCGFSNSSISCYSQKGIDGLMNFENLSTSLQCEYFLSAISVAPLYRSEAVSTLEVQTIELGWWLEGKCQCVSGAKCVELVSPVNGRPAFRCECPEGFLGDGYLAGDGCRKVSVSHCYPVKYIYGECGGRTRVLVLIGGVFGGAFLMLSLGLICCLVRWQTKLRAQTVTKRRITEATQGSCIIPIYTYKEIEKATNSFSDKQRLGTGAYGTVYAGKLQGDHEWVAIKRIKNRDNDTIEQVMNEIKLISSVTHPNLVRLLGCSIENSQQIVVYEFMPNGTLYQHLQRERGEGLSWPIRVTIATETARAIAHLHSAIKPPIFHRDIKSSNILLDYSFKSKVADFGLSRLGLTETSHISTAPQGTPGYLDPQYHQDFHLSDKSDVYSFGVVLAEMLTGLKVVDFSRPKYEVNLAALATDRIGNGCLDEIIDPILYPHEDAWTLLSMHKVAEIAFRCLAFHRDMRPSMMEVAAELEELRLSRWTHSISGVKNYDSELGVPGLSTCCSSLSDSSGKVLSCRVDKEVDGDGFFHSMDKMKDNSPVSVQELWSSEHSSPSSSSLLNNVIL